MDLGYCAKKSKSTVFQARRQTVVVISSRILLSCKLPAVAHFSPAVNFRRGIKCRLRTCGPADRQRYNLQTKNLQTVTADHRINYGPQFADQTGVEVLNDGPFWMFNAPA